MEARASSAPGKCLLAGGYLVTERKYRGLVYGLDARIHAIVKPVASAGGAPAILARSPQFKDASWSYAILQKPNCIEVEEKSSPE